MTWACLVFVAALVIMAAAAPLIASDPSEMNFDLLDAPLRPPGDGFLFGTDFLGRSVGGQLIWGARISLLTAFVAALCSTLLGTAIGAFAGYVGGKTDLLLMRVVDAALMVPHFFLILLIVAIFGPSIGNLILAISITTWPETARLLRAEVLGQRHRDYVRAARVAGAGPLRILFGEILPNGFHPVIVKASLLTGQAILLEASLGFLGLTDPTVTSWGRMVKDALPVFREAWWTLVAPGVLIAATIASLNLIGDALNRYLRPAQS
jgi:peptide/nickel transport system permease protein